MQWFTDWNSRRERKLTARRSRSRKLEQVRNGYVVPNHTPPYGFRFAGERTKRTLAVVEERMEVVRRIFRMMGEERVGATTVARRLTEEGIPPPTHPTKKKPEGNLYRSRHFPPDVVGNDLYKPHTREEIAALVEDGFMAPDVAIRLDPEEVYGIWLYTGRDFEGDEHVVAIPVPDSGVPRELVGAARRSIERNVAKNVKGDAPFRELGKGILHCAGCGRRLQQHKLRGKRGQIYRYWRCPFHSDMNRGKCPSRIRLRVGDVEEVVWEFVGGFLAEPWVMLDGVDDLIGLEREKLRGDPEAEQRELRATLETLVRRRTAYQDQQAAGLMTMDELKAKLGDIAEDREGILRGIEACVHRGERIRELVALRESLQRRAGAWGGLMDKHPDLGDHVVGDPPWASDPFAAAGRESLEACTPQQRREHYLSLELRVDVRSPEELEISGIFGKETIYTCASSSPSWLPRTRGRSRELTPRNNKPSESATAK